LAYWCAWRPLPQRSGTIEAPIDAAASVSFDALGVPHIRAASQEDALFIQGYVTAQDRLWQMDALRRYAGGDLPKFWARRASIRTANRAGCVCGASPKTPMSRCLRKTARPWRLTHGA